MGTSSSAASTQYARLFASPLRHWHFDGQKACVRVSVLSSVSVQSSSIAVGVRSVWRAQLFVGVVALCWRCCLGLRWCCALLSAFAPGVGLLVALVFVHLTGLVQTVWSDIFLVISNLLLLSERLRGVYSGLIFEFWDLFLFLFFIFRYLMVLNTGACWVLKIQNTKIFVLNI